MEYFISEDKKKKTEIIAIRDFEKPGITIKVINKSGDKPVETETYYPKNGIRERINNGIKSYTITGRIE